MLTYKNVDELKNGATLDCNLNLVSFKQGYQVGITNNVSAEATIELELGKAAQIAKQLTEAENVPHYVGVWHDGKDWYIDVSLYVPHKEQALAIGRACEQQAIFDWQTMESLEVK